METHRLFKYTFLEEWLKPQPLKMYFSIGKYVQLKTDVILNHIYGILDILSSSIYYHPCLNVVSMFNTLDTYNRIRTKCYLLSTTYFLQNNIFML